LFSKPKTVERREILKRLYELGHSDDQLANTILALMVTSSVELTVGEALPEISITFSLIWICCEATTNIVNLYLDADHVKNIAAIAKTTDKKAELDAYLLEALRQFHNANNWNLLLTFFLLGVHPPFPGVYRALQIRSCYEAST